MTIAWFGLAEGVAEDARGALTLVGFDTDTAIAASGSTVRRVAVLILEPSPSSFGAISVTIALHGPSGLRIAEHVQYVSASQDGDALSGSRLRIATEVLFEVVEAGAYRFSADVRQSDGAEQHAECALLVLGPAGSQSQSGGSEGTK